MMWTAISLVGFLCLILAALIKIPFIIKDLTMIIAQIIHGIMWCITFVIKTIFNIFGWSVRKGSQSSINNILEEKEKYRKIMSDPKLTCEFYNKKKEAEDKLTRLINSYPNGGTQHFSAYKRAIQKNKLNELPAIEKKIKECHINNTKYADGKLYTLQDIKRVIQLELPVFSQQITKDCLCEAYNVDNVYVIVCTREVNHTKIQRLFQTDVYYMIEKNIKKLKREMKDYIGPVKNEWLTYI